MSLQLSFAEIKQRISIVKGAKLLGLSLREDGNSFRCACPFCNGDDRSLSLLEEANSFKCFKSGKYGSIIDLVMHVKDVGIREASQWLVDNEHKEWLDEYEKAPHTPSDHSLKPLENRPKLNANADEVKELGLDTDLAERMGIGFASKGLLKGTVGVPLYIDGAVIGYLGIPKGTWVKLPKNLLVQS